VGGTVQGRGYLLVETHGLAALKTAVFVEHGSVAGRAYDERTDGLAGSGNERRERWKGSGFK
jgi:hypothetical protein